MTDTYVCELVDSQTFLRADPKLRTQIIRLGVHTYENIPRSELVISNHDDARLRHKQECIDALECELNELRSKFSSNMETQLDEQREQLAHEFEVRLTQARQLAEQRTEMSDLRRKIERDNYEVMYDKEKEYHEKELESYKREVNQMKDMYESVKAQTRTYTNNTEKGQDGENMIEAYIWTIPGAKSTNTGKTASCTDIRCSFGHCEILIESKNVKVVQKREIDKFTRDVQMNASSVNGAIFVSIMEGVRVPNKCAFDFEMISGVPCIYVSGFEGNKNILLAAFQWLELYNQNSSCNVSTNKVHDMLFGALEEWKRHVDALQKHKRLINTLLQDAATMENNMTRSMMNTKTQLQTVLGNDNDMNMEDEDEWNTQHGTWNHLVPCA